MLIFANLIMTYDTLRNAYLESRKHFTKIIEYSEKIGLEDGYLSSLLDFESSFAPTLFRMLDHIQTIKEGNKGFLITQRIIGLDKDRIINPLAKLHMHAEMIKEALEIANGGVDEEIMKTIRNFCHSLNKLDDIVTDLTLENVSTKKTE